MNRRFFAQSIAAGLVAVASTHIGHTQAAGPDAAQVAKWLTVQPLIQHYRNPGADSAVRNATVVGVRVELAL